MTISTTASRQDYTGDGCTLAFAYTFKIPATSDLDVFVAGTQKTLTTDYTVSGAGAATGGTVTFGTAPGCGLAVAIVRDVAYTQATAYPENNPFPASSHEDALDKVTMLAQQVKELVTRSWRFAAGSVRAAAGYVVDEPKAGTYPRVKADCTGIEFVTLTACGTYADPVTTKGDLIVGAEGGDQERLAMVGGPTTYILATDNRTGFTGKPLWVFNPPISVTNKFDAALTQGDVVAFSSDCNKAVKASNVQGCLGIFAVAGHNWGDDCLGFAYWSGFMPNVKAQGTITRGDWVRKSATAQAVESTGVGSNCDRMMPNGTLGLALTTAAGNLVDLILLGQTHRQVPVLDQLTGLALSNGTDATNDIDIAIGAAASDDAAIADREIVSLTAAITKQLDAVWAAGSAAGGRFPAGAPPATCDTYHVFVIKNPTTNVIDIGFDTSVTAANIPTGFTKQRRIGSIIWDGSTIVGFVQDGDLFQRTTPILDWSHTNPGTAAVTVSLWVPTDINVRAMMNATYGSPGSAAIARCYLSDLAITDAAPSQTAAPLFNIGHDESVGTTEGGKIEIRTNTSGQIRARADTSGVSHVLRIATLGWLDRRGRG